MELGISQISEIFISVALIIVITLFTLRLFSKNNTKPNSNKLMLKKLLEGFDLELPEELKEIDGHVVKTIKSR